MQGKSTTSRNCCQCGTAFPVPRNKPSKRFCRPDCYHLATRRPAAERFWEKVEKTEACWLWKGGCDWDGYGAFHPTWRTQVKASRYSWELHNGPVPDGLQVCHACDVPACVRPDHLWLGTGKDNSRDAAKKGRRPRGEGHHAVKLTEAIVRAIRARYAAGGVRQVDLAREFGISQPVVSAIVVRRTWRHLG